jgi:hypothetical protein
MYKCSNIPVECSITCKFENVRIVFLSFIYLDSCNTRNMYCTYRCSSSLQLSFEILVFFAPIYTYCVTLQVLAQTRKEYKVVKTVQSK